MHKFHIHHRYQLLSVVIGTGALLVLAAIGGNRLATQRQAENMATTHAVLSQNTTQSPDIRLTAQLIQSESIGSERHQRVQATIQNLSRRTILISPGMQFNVIDTTGRAFAYSAAYTSPDQAIGGSLPPRESLTIELDFDLPSQSVPQSLRFEETTQSGAVEVQF